MNNSDILKFIEIVKKDINKGNLTEIEKRMLRVPDIDKDTDRYRLYREKEENKHGGRKQET